MISELVTLELYFGRLEAVMTLEDLVRRFGEDKVAAALRKEELELRPSLGRTYAVLTEKARHHAPVPLG